MIPSVDDDVFLTELEDEETPNKNYMMNIDKTRVSGYCDELLAVQQSIYKILSTERYQHIIYSWNYGIQLEDLFGQPIDYCCSELQRRITEAVEWDDRVESCDSFKFDTSQRHIIAVTFTAHTIFGDIEIEKAVNV